MEEKKKENKEEKKVEKIKEVKREKNKKAPWITTAIVVVVVLVIAALLTVMIVTSSDPKKSVDGLLTNLREGDFETANQFSSSEKSTSTSEILNENLNQETQKLLFEKLSWKVLKVTENGNEATVEIEVTNKDFKTILGNVMQKALKAAFSGGELTEEASENYLLEELKNSEVQTATVTKTINLVKQDKKWKVIIDNEFVNAVLKDDAKFLTKKSKNQEVTQNLSLNENISAPIFQGQKIRKYNIFNFWQRSFNS